MRVYFHFLCINPRADLSLGWALTHADTQAKRKGHGGLGSGLPARVHRAVVLVGRSWGTGGSQVARDWRRSRERPELRARGRRGVTRQPGEEEPEPGRGTVSRTLQEGGWDQAEGRGQRWTDWGSSWGGNNGA